MLITNSSARRDGFSSSPLETADSWRDFSKQLQKLEESISSLDGETSPLLQPLFDWQSKLDLKVLEPIIKDLKERDQT